VRTVKDVPKARAGGPETPNASKRSVQDQVEVALRWLKRHATKAEGSQTSRTGRNHAAVGRLLLEAGSPVDWQQGEEPSEGILEIVDEWRGVQTEYGHLRN
jgi:hypothetical protein